MTIDLGTRVLLLGALALTTSVSCKDPTEGKAKAEVGEAVEITSPPPPADSKKERLPVSPGSSKVEFVGAKVTAKHDGAFKKFDGNIDLVDGDPEKSSVDVVIDVKSLVIEPAKLQGHLLSKDFFDAEKYPTSKFVSTSIKKGGSDGATHTVNGNLELHGQSKSITFPATISVTPSKATAKAEFGINRKDFGIVYPGPPDDLIADEVLIKLDLEAPRSAAN